MGGGGGDYFRSNLTIYVKKLILLGLCSIPRGRYNSLAMHSFSKVGIIMMPGFYKWVMDANFEVDQPSMSLCLFSLLFDHMPVCHSIKCQENGF